MRGHTSKIFLNKTSELFEIVFFNPSIESYANNVIDYIDPERKASGRLFRDACVKNKDYYVKDLSRLGRDLSNVIIIDNSPTSYRNHIENAIPIKSWFGNEKDTELNDLLPILESLAKVKDVRKVISKIISKMAK